MIVYQFDSHGLSKIQTKVALQLQGTQIAVTGFVNRQCACGTQHKVKVDIRKLVTARANPDTLLSSELMLRGEYDKIRTRAMREAEKLTLLLIDSYISKEFSGTCLSAERTHT